MCQYNGSDDSVNDSCCAVTVDIIDLMSGIAKRICIWTTAKKGIKPNINWQQPA